MQAKKHTQISYQVLRFWMKWGDYNKINIQNKAPNYLPLFCDKQILFIKWRIQKTRNRSKSSKCNLSVDVVIWIHFSKSQKKTFFHLFTPQNKNVDAKFKLRIRTNTKFELPKYTHAHDIATLSWNSCFFRIIGVSRDLGYVTPVARNPRNLFTHSMTIKEKQLRTYPGF